MTIGEKIDALYEARAARLQYQKQCDEEIAKLKGIEEEARASIIEELRAAGLKGAKGTLATAAITQSIVPKASDWEALHGYILEHKALDLFERRISRTAYRERLDAGEVIPGVEQQVVTDISLTKAGGAK